jgi:hypothetical protein
MVACRTHGTHEKCVQNFGGNQKRRSHFEDLDADGNIILKWILKK